MSDESVSSAQPVAASEASPSVPPAPRAPTPSVPPGQSKSTLRHVLEAVVDLAAIAVAGGLAWVGKVDGNVALVVVSLLAGVRVSDLVNARSGGNSGPGSPGGPSAGGIAGGVLWLLGHLAPRAQHAAGLTVLALSIVALDGCAAGQTPVLSPVTPRVIQRAEWGTCVETGGKIELPNTGVVAMLTSACFAPMDAATTLDASAPIEDSDADVPPDAIKPSGSLALVLPDYWRGQCTVPVFVEGAKTLADLDPVRCAVTAPGDRLVVFRRGQRWVSR